MIADSQNIFNPLVSVIIPCYNQAHYLEQAIQSVLEQTYKPVEIIVIDDGSTDETKIISSKYPSLKYVYQQNQGLSAARNTGIDQSTGSFLVFLDSDDWLLPHALETNLPYLLGDDKAMFVSGSHRKIMDNNIIPERRKPITLSPYQQLLHQNYIGMIAAVMFRREIFDHYRYDTSLKGCEDYDLYLRITRDYPVINHVQEIAAYRFHENNMSGNIVSMLSSVLTVLQRQNGNLRERIEKKYYRAGLYNWKKYYLKIHYLHCCKLLSQGKMIDKKAFLVFSNQWLPDLKYLQVSLYFQYLYANIKRRLKN